MVPSSPHSSGLQRTRALVMTFLYCRWPPLSSPCLIRPGNATQEMSLSARVSSSSPPMSSMVLGSNRVRWWGTMVGMWTRRMAFWTARRRASSMELLTRTRSALSRFSDVVEVVEDDEEDVWVVMASRRRLMREMTCSTHAEVSSERRWGASRRMRESVEARHWFTASSAAAG